MRIPVWLRGVLLLAVTFTAGAILGVSYERGRTPRHERSDHHSDQMIEHMTRDLNLDAAQREAVAKIVAHRQGAIDSTWHAIQPHVHATLDSTLREIAAVLRPDQLVRYRSMLASRHPEAMR